nr:hypothetical protein [uncultured Ottowia sp.]
MSQRRAGKHWFKDKNRITESFAARHASGSSKTRRLSDRTRNWKKYANFSDAAHGKRLKPDPSQGGGAFWGLRLPEYTGAARSGINANSSSSAGYAVHHLHVAPYRILGLKSGNRSRFS